jgi:hypothetical protein
VPAVTGADQAGAGGAPGALVGIQTSNSIVASICARNTSDPSRPDFGYRPAMASIIERLQAQIAKL